VCPPKEEKSGGKEEKNLPVLDRKREHQQRQRFHVHLKEQLA